MEQGASKEVTRNVMMSAEWQKKMQDSMDDYNKYKDVLVSVTRLESEKRASTTKLFLASPPKRARLDFGKKDVNYNTNSTTASNKRPVWTSHNPRAFLLPRFNGMLEEAEGHQQAREGELLHGELLRLLHLLLDP